MVLLQAPSIRLGAFGANNGKYVENTHVVLKPCVLDNNYATVMHVPLSTPNENTFSF